jgi:hypothetical protein
MAPVSEKLTPQLRSRLAAANPADPLELVIELAGDAGAERDVGAAKAAFEQLARPLGELIDRLGGRAIALAWINHTVLAQVPSGEVHALLSLDEVVLVDVPHALTRA